MRKANFRNQSEEADFNAIQGTAEEDQIPSMKGVKVLIIDDDGDTAFIMARMLMNEGVLVKWASSVSEAFEWIDSFQPNLILSDLSMPEADGFDLIRKLRAMQAPDQVCFVPAIAVSASASPAVMQRSFEEGYQAFFPKPLKSQYLIEAVARLSQLHRNLSIAPAKASIPLKRVF